jgi:undecaprenyl-diphosphatase
MHPVHEASRSSAGRIDDAGAQAVRDDAARASVRSHAVAMSEAVTRPDRARGSWLAFALRWASWAIVGVALVLVAGFVELSEELLDPEQRSTRLVGADAAVLRLFALVRRPWLNGVAMDLTALGSPILVALFTIALGAVLLVKGDRRGATILVVSSFASAIVTSVAKRLLERPRPEIVPRLVEVTGLSYPSGHSLASAAVYLTAAFVVARHVALLRERVAGVLSTAVLVLTIGVSRVYLGVHYPSDVFGGILLGTAWALVMGVLLGRLDRIARGRESAPPRPKDQAQH